MPLASRPWSLAAARLALGLLVLVPVVVLLWRTGFAGLYGQDAFGYANYALGPLRDALFHLDLPPAWPQPPGYPMVVSAVSLLAGPDGRIGLLVSLIAGASLPVFTALLAAETLGPRLTGRAGTVVPLLAGLLAALTGQLWQSSAVAMADTLAVALATAGAWAACRYARGGAGGLVWLLAAAAASAFAIDTRWVNGLVAVPIAAVGLFGVAQRWRADRTAAVGHVLAAALVVLAVLAPVAIPIGRAWLDGGPVPFTADFGAYHWDPVNALSSAFDTTDGRLTYGLTSGLFYVLQPVQPYWFGPLGVLALLGGAWVVRRAGGIATTLLVGWPLLVGVFLAGSPYQNTRFALSVLPPLATLIAVGLWRLVVFVDARLPGRWRARAGMTAAVLAAVWLVAGVLVAGRFTDAFIARQSDDLAAIRSLEAVVPPAARIVSMGPTGVFAYDGLPDVVELYGLTPPDAAALVADGRPTYVVIDPSAIDGQWAGRGPALTVASLRASPGLTPLATAGQWTLYRLGPSAGS